jgi:hypothetical protein
MLGKAGVRIRQSSQRFLVFSSVASGKCWNITTLNDVHLSKTEEEEGKDKGED